RFANMQHRFDVARERRLAATKIKPQFLSLDDALDKIGSDTALVTMFLGETANHQLGVRTLTVYKRTVRNGLIDCGIDRSPKFSNHGGFELVVPPLGDMVAVIRNTIRGEPGFQPVRQDGAEMLQACEGMLLTTLRDLIIANPEIRHVCI